MIVDNCKYCGEPVYDGEMHQGCVFLIQLQLRIEEAQANFASAQCNGDEEEMSKYDQELTSLNDVWRASERTEEFAPFSTYYRFKRAVRMCPRCEKEYIGVPALSRKDNTTAICPDCGTEEALEQFEEIGTVSLYKLFLVMIHATNNNGRMQTIFVRTSAANSEDAIKSALKHAQNTYSLDGWSLKVEECTAQAR